MSPEGPKTLVGATEIYKHKPLGADEIAQIERDSSFSEETGSSAWNKGGTWEEKDYSKWAEARIKEVMLSIALFFQFFINCFSPEPSLAPCCPPCSACALAVLPLSLIHWHPFFSFALSSLAASRLPCVCVRARVREQKR